MTTTKWTKADWDLLFGLHAYDDGAVDSGIRDEAGRARLIDGIRDADDAWQEELTRRARNQFMSDEAISEGYGIADLANFIEWIGDKMNCDLG